MSSIQGNTIDFDSARLKLSQANSAAAPPKRAVSRPVPVAAVLQRLTQLLQTTLELDRLLDIFHQELARCLAVDGMEYRNDGRRFHLRYGQSATHRCSYRITHAGEYLGDLQFSRQKRFGEVQLASLETLIGSLLYPLRNALMYHEAVSSALSDTLTNTGNRLALSQALDREVQLSIRHRTPLSLLVVDIDHFKQINDRFGHAYGDEALKAMASCTHDCLRAVDSLFRLGGEEFVVLLNNTDLASARIVAERIRRAIEAMQFEIDGQPICMTVSLGAVMRQPEETSRDLIDRCDKLMYLAKQSGRNRVMV
ncbi:GGDEF domain-containing protein [Halopseudomonas nanhaiensis]|uniref:GGDEF domain-containing protein n=1 Tax=Halopseudomonas nanhaiensis TaxID=2830842 RepID=UPI001CC09066|nr:GGDEF domain-containing protein [Halopseudomonas nanhaiensis]UAW97346.1 GGDEF domain-containing protein [Halopseudomonas nanhaiensis]